LTKPWEVRVAAISVLGQTLVRARPLAGLRHRALSRLRRPTGFPPLLTGPPLAADPGLLDFGRPNTSVRRPGAGRLPRWVLDPNAPSPASDRISVKMRRTGGDKECRVTRCRANPTYDSTAASTVARLLRTGRRRRPAPRNAGPPASSPRRRQSSSSHPGVRHSGGDARCARSHERLRHPRRKVTRFAKLYIAEMRRKPRRLNVSLGDAASNTERAPARRPCGTPRATPTQETM
jgi:hypothetical protein